jgi:large subunit ribosomal protein L9
MELLLVEDVPGLGGRGEIVNVARGYARNYLLPRGLAQVPTEQAKVEIQRRTERLKAESEAIRADRMDVAKELATAAITLEMKASSEGHLYGSVGPKQIVEALGAQGFAVEEKHVQLEHPLKELGEFEVVIALHPEVQVPVQVTIAGEED